MQQWYQDPHSCTREVKPKEKREKVAEEHQHKSMSCFLLAR